MLRAPGRLRQPPEPAVLPLKAGGERLQQIGRVRALKLFPQLRDVNLAGVTRQRGIEQQNEITRMDGGGIVHYAGLSKQPRGIARYPQVRLVVSV